MIDEDLRVARDRARHWAELSGRRRRLAADIERVRQASGARDQEIRLVAELEIVDRELADIGPVREVYEELLAREERRLIESADPRGAELLVIGRALAELDVASLGREHELAHLRDELVARRESLIVE